MATGLTNEPNIPVIKGSDSFGKPVVRSVDFAGRSDLIETAKRVVVLGGAKSAWDIAYAFASAGAEVDMVMSKAGKGPAWVSPAYVTPMKKMLEKLVTTRLITFMSPCIWGHEDGYGTLRSWMHGTSVGRWVVEQFWMVLDSDLVKVNGTTPTPP